MLKKLERILREEMGIASGERLLVALSGGKDSVALLHLLHRLAPNYPLVLRAAHLDHALRDDSPRDARFVEGACDRLGIPLTVERIEVEPEAQKRRAGIEEAAREIRRAFLEKTASAYRCRWIVLGHHRGDQAETVLHRLLRGSSVSGLAAMRPVSGRYLRPLLGFSPSSLIDYLKAEGVEWVEDSSNLDPRFTRNRIRHELLPHLREFNPRIEEHLCRMGSRFAAEEDFWREEVEVVLSRLGRVEAEGVCLDVPGVIDLHPALRMRVIRRALDIVRGGLGGIASAHLEAVERLLWGRGQAEVDLPGGWVARRYFELWVRRSPPSAAAEFRILLPGPGSYLLPDGRELRLFHVDHSLGEDAGAVEFDPVRIAFPLTVRTPVPGDRFHPAGAPGGKKLKDFFIDKKVPREIRRSLPVLEDGEILWLVGMRRCDGRLPVEGGGVLRITVSPRQKSDIPVVKSQGLW